MARNPIQDVLPPSRRSIRSVTINKSPIKSSWSKNILAEKQDNPYSGGKNRKGSKLLLWTLAGLSILIVVMLVLSSFSQSSIVVTLKKKDIPVDINITAAKDVNSSVPFEFITLKKEGKLSVKADQPEEVKKKASGTIIVYNNSSASAQRLIKNTRFQTVNGLIFRIPESIVIPGKKIVEGKSIPGSVETIVYADEAGDKYNIDLTDFTIPSFKGDPKFTTFYARSKTPMTGGFVGIMRKVAPADELSARESIRNDLRAKLAQEAQVSKPAKYVLYAGAYYFDWKSLPDEAESDSSVFIREEGTMTAIIFDSEAISNQIIKENISKLDNIPMSATNIDNLAFKAKQVISKEIANSKTIQFNLSGTANFVSILDNSKFISAIAGASQSVIPNILKNFPEISKVETTIRPIWKRSFPIDQNRITIKVN